MKLGNAPQKIRGRRHVLKTTAYLLAFTLFAQGVFGMRGIQLKAEALGQYPTYELATFSVNPVATNLSYDANGALLTLPVVGPNSDSASLAWNAEGRLASTTSGTSTNRFFYDDHGRRIAKVEDGTLELYLWDGMDVIGVADSAASLKEYYSRGVGIGDVGSLVAETRFSGGASTALLHANHRGGVVLATDTTGAVVHEAEYLPFGNRKSATGNYSPRFGFSSKERDASGLVYYGYRYYAPQLNAWISPDPSGVGGGVNLYTFCGNRPIASVDILGLYEYDTANVWVAFVHESNPWNSDGTFSRQAISIGNAIGGSAAWLAGYREGAHEVFQESVNNSGHAVLDELCASRSAYIAYWGAYGVSLTVAISAGSLIGLEAAGVSKIGSAHIGWRGGEITFTTPGKPTPDWRINPFGGSGYPPHYHRRGPGGIGRHRPWQPGPGGFPGRF